MKAIKVGTPQANQPSAQSGSANAKDDPMQTRNTILVGCQHGDEAAWKLFFDQYFPFVVLVGLGLSLALEDAKDLAMETMLELMKKLKQPDWKRDPDKKFRGLVRLMAKRACWKAKARVGRLPTVSLDQEEQEDRPLHERIADANGHPPGEEHDVVVKLAMVRLALWRAVSAGKISERDVAIFILLASGQKSEGVAEQFSTSVNAVYQANFRVKRALQNEVKIMRPDIGLEEKETPEWFDQIPGLGQFFMSASFRSANPQQFSAKTLVAGSEMTSPVEQRLFFAYRLQKEAPLGEAPGYLLYRDENHKANACPVTAEFIVGRATPSHLALPATTRMSGKHFRVVATEDGFVLEDLNSRNGTYVNGSKVQRDELTSGDVIEAGGQAFCFIMSPKL